MKNIDINIDLSVEKDKLVEKYIVRWVYVFLDKNGNEFQIPFGMGYENTEYPKLNNFVVPSYFLQKAILDEILLRLPNLKLPLESNLNFDLRPLMKEKLYWTEPSAHGELKKQFESIIGGKL